MIHTEATRACFTQEALRLLESGQQRALDVARALRPADCELGGRVRSGLSSWAAKLLWRAGVSGYSDGHQIWYYLSGREPAGTPTIPGLGRPLSGV